MTGCGRTETSNERSSQLSQWLTSPSERPTEKPWTASLQTSTSADITPRASVSSHATAGRPRLRVLVGAFAEARSGPIRTILAVTTKDLDPPELQRPDGEEVEVTYGRYRKEVSHPNRVYRRRVYEAFLDELGRFEATLATAYVEKLKAASTLADVRGYGSLREAALRFSCYPESGLEAALPPAVHETMLAAIEENLGPRERDRALRADHLGVEDVHPWDLHAPLVDAAEPEISFEEALAHIVAAMEPLGDNYQARVRAFFDEDRVDVYEYDGKRNDIPAYCPSSATDGAYILMNFQEDIRTMFYLCHELGHAMNVAHHREEPTRYATSPRPLEEVPSILHELLLIEHCLTEDRDLAAHARNRLVNVIEGNFYNAATWSAFSHRLGRAVDEGKDPDAKRIATAFEEVMDLYDPTVSQSSRMQKGWLIGTLIREPYHHYQYTLGATGALAVRERLESGALSPGKYQTFLSETGRRSAVESFEQLGLDLQTTAPYERAAGRFDAYLDEFA